MTSNGTSTSTLVRNGRLSPLALVLTPKDLPTDVSTSWSKGGVQMFHGLSRWVVGQMHELNNERGATAVEYGLMVALIAAIIVAVVGLLGQEIRAAFQTVLDALP